MKKRNLFKLAALTAVFALAGMFANAQTTLPGDSATTRQYADGPTIKVIDNKGTVKYIQSNNGITSITSTIAGQQTVTTFQLGGTLTDSTFIDVNNNPFGIDNLTFNSLTRTYDFIVADTATGEFRRMPMTDLVDAGTFIKVIGASDVTNGVVVGNTFAIPVTGVTLESFKTVYVFRNGAKLIAGVDYIITTTTSSTVTLNLATGQTVQYTSMPLGADEAFNLYQGDRIEIQYIK